MKAAVLVNSRQRQQQRLFGDGSGGDGYLAAVVLAERGFNDFLRQKKLKIEELHFFSGGTQWVEGL